MVRRERATTTRPSIPNSYACLAKMGFLIHVVLAGVAVLRSDPRMNEVIPVAP